MNRIVRFFTVAFLFTALAAQAHDSYLEIINKGPRTIHVDVKVFIPYNKQTVNYTFPIEPNATNNLQELPLGNTTIDISESKDMNPKYSYAIDNNALDKTKFLTWNPKLYPKNPLHPQSRTLLGISKKSQTGRHLGNNISQKEIVLMSKP